MSGNGRPGDRWQEPFWEGLSRGQIMIQRCTADHHQFPGAPQCGRCGRTTEWVPVEGVGTVWSYAVFHHNYLGAFESLLPYPVLLLELAEGARIYAGLHPDEADIPSIGTPVRLEISDYPLGPVPLARTSATDGTREDGRNP